MKDGDVDVTCEWIERSTPTSERSWDLGFTNSLRIIHRPGIMRSLNGTIIQPHSLSLRAPQSAYIPYSSLDYYFGYVS